MIFYKAALKQPVFQKRYTNRFDLTYIVNILYFNMKTKMPVRIR